MSEFIQIIEHKGKKVIFFNCAGMDPDVAAGLFPEVTRTAIEHRINLVCSDVSNSSANDALKAAAAARVSRPSPSPWAPSIPPSWVSRASSGSSPRRW